MSSRTQSHQLNNGLYVSGRPGNNPTNLRIPTMSSRSVYTGGDVTKSGDLAKMFDLSSSSQPPTPKPPSRHSSQPNSGSGPQPIPAHVSRPNSGSGPQPILAHISRPNSGSGPQPGASLTPRPGSGSGPQTVPSRLSGSGRVARKTPDPLPLHPTGLITSGPLTSTGGQVRRSGQIDGQAPTQTGIGTGGGKMVYGAAVTNMVKGEKARYGVKVSKGVMWVFVILVLMGLLVGVFLMVAVKKPIILVAVGAVLVPVLVGLGWNYAWKRRAVLGFVTRFPDKELRGAVDGQLVKVTGVVTCGSIPLESSFQRVPRCVYVSTELYEYKGWGGKSANSKHRCLSWGTRHSEKYVADFYVSDFHTGLRALVKSGYGAKVSPFVESATVVDVTKEKRDLSPNFLEWLSDRSLSSDDRIMRLKEGYVKEGSTVSVMGVVRRHENIVMIVPPEEPISTGCQWLRCLLPMYIEGLILHCEDNQNSEVIPV